MAIDLANTKLSEDELKALLKEICQEATTKALYIVKKDLLRHVVDLFTKGVTDSARELKAY